MATKTPAKKSTPKKTTAKASVKKAPVKKAVAKKPVTRSKKTTTKKSAAMQSFKVYPSQEFTSLKPTRQTIYWIIILGIITVAQLFILKIQLEIVELTQPVIF